MFVILELYTVLVESNSLSYNFPKIIYIFLEDTLQKIEILLLSFFLLKKKKLFSFIILKRIFFKWYFWNYKHVKGQKKWVIHEPITCSSLQLVQ